MSSHAQGNLEVSIQVSPQLTMVADALAPVAKSVRKAVSRKIQSSGHQFTDLEYMSIHMPMIEDFLVRLEPRVEAMMPDVIISKRVDPLQIGRIVGRLEQVIFELVDGYWFAKSATVKHDDTKVCKLILGVYRHHLKTICKWLDDVVSMFSSPLRAIENMSPRIDQGDCNVEVIVSLNITAPPEMSQLLSLLLKMRREAEELVNEEKLAVESKTTRSPSIWGSVGGLAFGVAVADAVFGKSCD